MKPVTTLHAGGVHPAEPLASWYMPGMIDGFGDRLLMIDNAASDALELLRFRAALRDTPGFEDAVHDGLRRLQAVSHAGLSTIRGVERFERDGSLVLVSVSTPGQRLAQLLDERQPGQGLHLPFVIRTVGQILEAMAVLHAEGEDVAHSALTADRVVLAPDGSARIVEHVLGPALRHLGCSPTRLWEEFGILALSDDNGLSRLDRRGDIFQVGIMALSMLLARRITREDVDERLLALLDQWSESAHWQSFHEPLRRWLERALQIGGDAYASAADAHEEVRGLPLLAPTKPSKLLTAGPDAEGLGRLLFRTTTEPEGLDADVPRLRLAPVVETDDRVTVAATEGDDPALTGPIDLSTPVVVTPTVPPRSLAVRVLMRVALVAAVIAQAGIIAALVWRQTSAPAANPQALAPVAPVAAAATRQEPAASTPDTGSATAPGTAALPQAVGSDATSALLARAAQNQRLGGVRLSTPIELKVLQGDRVLGSSANGPIVTSAGTHDLELSNAELGFLARQRVTIRAGEIVTITVPVAAGRVNVNAAPWAEVWIDGRPLGETPLANVELPLGEHEIVFRHPNLGERRQRVVVRADAVARVTTTFDQ